MLLDAADQRIACEYVPQPGWGETLSGVMLNEIALESRWYSSHTLHIDSPKHFSCI